MKKRTLIIVGPTASGKSELAVRLAKKFGGEVISADSRQVYRGLDIGTGKITKKEMRGVPHHLLDVADPRKQFSAAQFVMLTNRAIAKIVNTGKLPIIVGGTGFYIDALTGVASVPEVPPDKLLRQKLNKLDKEKLFEMLKKKDPRRAKEIDRDNKVRLIRALEIVEALGHVPKITNNQPPTTYNFVYIGLKADDLDKRIHKRLKKRLEPMIREGKKLHSQGLNYKRMYELGLEYRYIAMYLEGKIGKQEMFEKLFTEIKRYAKRQRLWFKRNKKIRWFTLSGVEGFGPKEYEKITGFCFNVLK